VNDDQDIEDALGGDLLEDTDPSLFEASGEAAPEPEPVRLTGPQFSFEEMLGSAREAAVQAPAEPAPVAPIPRAPPARPAFNASEPPMTTSARYAHTALTDEHTADVAAGALGKLLRQVVQSEAESLRLIRPEIPEEVREAGLDSLRGELQALQRRMEALEPVNMLALEELEQTLCGLTGDEYRKDEPLLHARAHMVRQLAMARVR
jgi:hypothetical protein